MKYLKLAQKVKKSYLSSSDWFAQWMIANHLPFVAKKAEKLSIKYNANIDLAVAGAWLHDFGDAFIDRHHKDFDAITQKESIEVLRESDYSEVEIKEILDDVIKPHSCRDGLFPTTLEGKIMATADAYAHLSTDFYLQFAWLHLPVNKTFDEYVEWVNGKIDRDFNKKIYFEEVRKSLESRYKSLKEIYKIPHQK